MSTVNVSYSRIRCDSCGTAADKPVLGATAARIQLAAEGWKYIEYDIKGLGLQKYSNEPGKKNYTVPRQWDCCPACPLPADAVEAAKIRDAKANT